MKPICGFTSQMVAQIFQYCNGPEFSKHSRKIRKYLDKPQFDE